MKNYKTIILEKEKIKMKEIISKNEKTKQMKKT